MAWTCRRCGGSNVAGTRFCGHCGAAAEESASHEERRLVTVLFADISGFTSLAERLDPEQLLEIMDPLLGRMNEVVARYGGRVNKYAGDAVLALFGVPTAHEDDAVRAVCAARDMREEISRLAAADGLELHIGVNTGHVIAGAGRRPTDLDSGVLGDTVNVAQRLESLAPSGEVYVGALTRQLVGTAFAFEEIGPVPVKGKAQPVGVWRLLGTPRPRTRPADAAPVAGRQAELSLLGERLAGSAAAGTGQCIAIVGEPGVGKSRLLEGARGSAAVGVRWLGARCLSYGAGLPYRPYVDLLYEVAGVGADAPVEQVGDLLRAAAERTGLAEQGPYLAHLVGAHPGEIPDGVSGSPEALRRAVHEAVVGLVLALAARQPVAVAIEDLHWADVASLELTRMLAGRVSGAPVTLLVTLRPEGRESFEKALVGTDLAVTEIELARLDRDSVRAVAQDVLGGPVDDELLDFVDEHAAGNPLFVQEVVRTLLDTARVERAATGWRLVPGGSGVPVPPSVEALLAARMDLLPAEVAHLLQVAAVVGRDVPLPLLAETSGLDADALDLALALLVDRGFLHRRSTPTEQRVTFHHALGVAVAYSRLLHRRRREIHRAVVAAAVGLYGEGDDVVDVLAHHAYLGRMGEPALRYLVRAARRAGDLYANAEAITHLERALETAGASDAPGLVRTVDLLLDKARLHTRLGQYDAALDCFDRAAADEPIRAAVGSAAVLKKLGRYRDALAAVDAAEHHPAPAAADRAALLLERGSILAFLAEPADSVAVLEQAFALVEGTGSQLEASICADLARALSLGDRDLDAVRPAERAVQILERNGGLAQLPRALRILGGVRCDVARLEAAPAEGFEPAARALERARAVAEQVGDAEEEAAAQLNLGVLRQEQDRPDEALAAFEGALSRFGDIGIRAGVASAYCNIADVLGDLDRWHEARRAAEAGLAVAREIDNQNWISGALIGIATSLLHEGDYARAEEVAEEAAAVARAAGLTGRAATAQSRAAEARERLGDPGAPGPGPTS